jgi:PAS domain S-box-containing protein
MKRSLPMNSTLSVSSENNWMNEFIYSAASFLKGIESSKDSSVNDYGESIFQNQSEYGIVFLGTEGRIAKVNRPLENLLGYFSKELENQSFTDFFLQRSSGLNSHGETEWYGLHKNGGEIPVSIRWINFQSVEDPFVMAFITPQVGDKNGGSNRSYNLREINEHLKRRLKQKAEQLERLAEKMKLAISEFQRQTEQKNHLESGLKKRKQLLNAIVKHFPDVNLFLLSERNDLRSLKVKGQSSVVSTSDFFSPELMSQLQKSFSGETITMEVSKDDKVFSIVASPVKDEKEMVEYSLIIVRNISDRKILGKRIGKILGKEKDLERLSVMSNLITTLSHKMRTPLSTILAAVFLLENYSHEEFNQEKDVLMGKIKRAVKAMTEFLTELDISQRSPEENENAGKGDGVERELPSNSNSPFLHVIKNSKDTDVSNPS